MRNDNQKAGVILAACGILPVVWIALLTAPFVGGGLVEVIRNFPIAMQSPFSITVCEDSVKTVLIFLLAYAMGIGIYFSTRRNYRRREEHGSAKWGDAKTLNKKYADKNFSSNKLLTQTVRIGLDGRKHRRNLNVLVCGGSGAGKTRFYCKINAMQCDAETSMVILDRYGVDTRGFDFSRLPGEYAQMETQDFKAELGGMRDVMCEIQTEMYKSLEKNKPAREKEQAR